MTKQGLNANSRMKNPTRRMIGIPLIFIKYLSSQETWQGEETQKDNFKNNSTYR